MKRRSAAVALCPCLLSRVLAIGLAGLPALGLAASVKVEIVRDDAPRPRTLLAPAAAGVLRMTVEANDGSRQLRELRMPGGAMYEVAAGTPAPSGAMTGLLTPIFQLVNAGGLQMLGRAPATLNLSTLPAQPQCDTSRLAHWNNPPAPHAAAIAARNSADPRVIGDYFVRQNFAERAGFTNALVAFSGVRAQDMSGFILDPANGPMLHEFSRQVIAHQDWYEPLVSRLVLRLGAGKRLIWPAPPVVFAKAQQEAMRAAFVRKDGALVLGALLLAYPERQSRNEAITRQYYEISQQMAQLTGGEADWSTFATWASDLVGRSLAPSDLLVTASESMGSNGRYWFSLGNAQLASQLPLAYSEFIRAFAGGANRGLSFNAFWERVLRRYPGYGVAYVDGDARSKVDVRNAFKTYYDAMKLYDEEARLSQSFFGQLDVFRRGQLASTRGQYVHYGNFLAVLSEQRLAQPVLENAMCVGGVVNPAGAGGMAVNFHLPGLLGIGDRMLPTAIGLPIDTPYRIRLTQDYTLYDGSRVQMAGSVRTTLNGLASSARLPVDKSNPWFSGTLYWNELGERMGFIYHLFADFQRDPQIHADPRRVYGSRVVGDGLSPTIEYTLLP